jgi:hypothetical protein
MNKVSVAEFKVAGKVTEEQGDEKTAVKGKPDTSWEAYLRETGMGQHEEQMSPEDDDEFFADYENWKKSKEGLVGKREE